MARLRGEVEKIEALVAIDEKMRRTNADAEVAAMLAAMREKERGPVS